MPDYTCTGLVASVLRSGLLPNTQETLANTDYFALMDEEIRGYMVPLIVGAREEYYVASIDVAYTTATDTYPLPYRAVGMKLRQALVQASTSTNTFVPLPRIEPERTYNYSLTPGSVAGYDLMGNNIVLVPPPNTAGTIRLRYYFRPNQPVDSSAAAQITSINTGTNTVTCGSALPSTFTSGLNYDLIKGTPGFDTYAFDQAGTVAGATVQFTALPTNLAVGDWVALSGQSPVPQIPYDLFPLLTARVTYRALLAAGDPKAATTKEEADELGHDLLGLIEPRTDGSPRVVINNFGPGFSRIGRFRRR